MCGYRTLVVEDFERFRRFVGSDLQQKVAFEVVAEASDGAEALQKAQELQPHLILLDNGLPTLNGLEVARRVRRLAPGAKILFLTQESSADVVHAALSLGAYGYVLKLHSKRDLLPAVETVLRGECFVSSELISKLPSSLPTLNLHSALCEVLAHAIEISGADMGNLQTLDRQTNSLHIVVQSGFSTQFLEFFDRVEHNQGSCGTALARGQRVIVDDVAEATIFSGTESGEIVIGEGVRAVQSIPLITASGQLMGVMSTHFRAAKPPLQKLFQITDAFAQGVAELIHSERYLSPSAHL